MARKQRGSGCVSPLAQRSRPDRGRRPQRKLAVAVLADDLRMHALRSDLCSLGDQPAQPCGVEQPSQKPEDPLVVMLELTPEMLATDSGRSAGAAANMAKYLAAKASWEAANACLQTHGGFGFAT